MQVQVAKKTVFSNFVPSVGTVPLAVADPGFPVGGGRGLRRRGCGLPRQLRFENFVCQKERIGTLGGGGAPP